MAISIGIGAIGALSSFVPLLGQVASAPLLASAHVVDRIKNSVEATDELAFRAKYYSPQIFKTLGISPRDGKPATVKQFKQAAAINPELSTVYKAPLKKESLENRSSMLTNGGIAAAGILIPGGGVVAAVGEAGKAAIETTKIAGEAAKVAKVVKSSLPIVGQMAGSVAADSIAHAITGEIVDPQQLLEAIHTTVADAKSRGMNMRDVVSPNLVFMLRVAQDEKFAKQIKDTSGKPFHNMSVAEQVQVMQAYPALANAATSEAYAVANDMLSIQELGATKPNLNAIANRYAVGDRNSSFAAKIAAQRAAAAAPTAPTI